jgi:hypothetical protein
MRLIKKLLDSYLKYIEAGVPLEDISDDYLDPIN